VRKNKIVKWCRRSSVKETVPICRLPTKTTLSNIMSFSWQAPFIPNNSVSYPYILFKGIFLLFSLTFFHYLVYSTFITFSSKSPVHS